MNTTSPPTSSDPDLAPNGRVLVVDDEQALARLVATYLERGGFEVVIVHDGPTALAVARDWAPDVIVLDLGLPGLDGVEVCRRVRTFSDCYVVMLTARSDEVDTLIGLSVGADDYVTKPFSPRELVARVQVMMRRPRRGLIGPFGELTGAGVPAPDADASTVRFGALMIDVQARELAVDGTPIDLTRTEFDIVAALAARPRVAFTRRMLVEAVWGDAWVGDEHLVDVHIAHVRKKLGDDAANPIYVRTVRGIGYRMGDGR